MFSFRWRILQLCAYRAQLHVRLQLLRANRYRGWQTAHSLKNAVYTRQIAAGKAKDYGVASLSVVGDQLLRRAANYGLGSGVAGPT